MYTRISTAFALILALASTAHAQLGADPAANRKYIQAQIDAGNPVVLPAATVMIDESVYMDRAGASLSGAGIDSTTLRSLAGPAVICGFRRAPIGGTPLSPADWINTKGLLDGTSDQGSGPVFRPGSHAAMVSGVIDTYPWQTASRLCVEVGIRLPAGSQSLPDCGIVGLFDRIDPSPWWTRCIQGQMSIAFRASDGVNRELRFPLSPAPGVRRITWQIDLKARTAQAYVDGVQVPYATGLKSLDSLPAGATFAPNNFAPFMVNSSGGKAFLPKEDADAGPCPGIAYLGLRVGTALRYADDGPGRPQRRLDNGLMNDWYRFARGGDDSVGRLKVEVDPTTASAQRRLLFDSPGGDTSALLVDSANASVTQTVGPATVRDLRLQGACGLLSGATATLHCERVDFHGTRRGLAGFSGIISYTTNIRDCRASGADVPIALEFGIGQINGLNLDATGRHGLRIREWRGNVRDVFSAGFGPCESFVFIRGAWASFDGLICDFEDGAHPTRALVEYDPRYWADGPHRITIRGLAWGGLGPSGIPLLLLGGEPAVIDAADMFSRSTPAAHVDAAPNWTGSINLLGLSPTPVASVGAGPGLSVLPAVPVIPTPVIVPPIVSPPAFPTLTPPVR